MTTRRMPLRRVAVLIPAHNEELLLARCLDSVHEAVSALGRVEPQIQVDVVLGLDRCSDHSLRIACGYPWLRTLRLSAGSAGATRHAAALEVLRTAPVPHEQTWLANTDADSRVHPDWLLDHVAAAEAGADVLVGAVQPDPADLDARTLALWWARHRLHDGHSHVFGANLGIRADVYLSIGGFPDVADGEDVALVSAARAAGVRVRSAARNAVVTSGRTRGRASAGFATYLNTLT